MLILALLVAAPAAHAQGRDADLEAGRRHYQRGAELFRQAQYAKALAEFETARAVQPRPEMSYDIARCHDLLEQWALAAEWYHRYLAEAPGAADAAAVAERVRLLDQRARAADRPGAPSRLRTAAVSVGVVGLAAAIAGAALYGTAAKDYADLHDACSAQQCFPANWSGAAARADVGYALLAVAGIAVAAEVVVMVLRGREIRRRNASPLSLAWGGP